jgi:hypothetical protein
MRPVRSLPPPVREMDGRPRSRSSGGLARSSSGSIPPLRSDLVLAGASFDGQYHSQARRAPLRPRRPPLRPPPTVVGLGLHRRPRVAPGHLVRAFKLGDAKERVHGWYDTGPFLLRDTVQRAKQCRIPHEQHAGINPSSLTRSRNRATQLSMVF